MKCSLDATARSLNWTALAIGPPQIRRGYEEICREQPRLNVRMMAMPHTASTTMVPLWLSHARPLRLTLNGSCAQGCGNRAFMCLQRLVLNHADRKHSSFDLCNSDRAVHGRRPALPTHQIVWTMLRHPASLLGSHFRDRTVWDAGAWPVFYPNEPLVMHNLSQWASKAWWRDNQLVKALACGRSKSLWLRRQPTRGANGHVSRDCRSSIDRGTGSFTGVCKPPLLCASEILPSRDEGARQNQLGARSEWYQIALKRIEGMPFFGMFERMEETFELVAFHLCIEPPDNLPTLLQHRQKPRMRSVALDALVRQRHALDLLLWSEANSAFDELMLEMRRLKRERGVVCSLQRTLKQPPGARCDVAHSCAGAGPNKVSGVE
jgi:hypothetical protein